MSHRPKKPKCAIIIYFHSLFLKIMLVSVYYNSEFLYIILYAILHILYSIDIIIAIKIGIILVMPNLHVSLEAVEWRLV